MDICNFKRVTANALKRELKAFVSCRSIDVCLRPIKYDNREVPCRSSRWLPHQSRSAPWVVLSPDLGNWQKLILALFPTASRTALIAASVAFLPEQNRLVTA